MITVEEAKKRGIWAKFTAPTPDFILTAKSDSEVEGNIMQMSKFNDLLNSNLSIAKYSGEFKNLIITYLVLQPNSKGVNWKERKYYKRSEQKYCIDISFPDYEGFCKASKKEALQIMAEQTIRGTKKYLSKEKNFDYEAFYNDLTNLLRNKNILVDVKE